MNREKKMGLMSNVGGVAMGVQILVEGVDKLPNFGAFPLHVSFLFLAGLFIIAGSFMHQHLEKKVKNVDALFYLIEGGVMMVSALILFEKGKIRMPLFILFIGLLYLVIGLVTYRMKDNNREKLAKRLIHGMGVFFILAAVAAFVTNLYVDRDAWVFGISVLLLLMGILNTFFSNIVVNRFLAKTAIQQYKSHINTETL